MKLMYKINKNFSVRSVNSISDNNLARKIIDFTWKLDGGTEITPNLLQAMVHSGAYLAGADLANKKVAGKFDGYFEAWSKSAFPVKSIKELMRLTEEFEESNQRPTDLVIS